MYWSAVKNILNQINYDDTTSGIYQDTLRTISPQLRVLQDPNEDIDKFIAFFDISIVNYVRFYECIRDDFLERKIHFGDKKYPDMLNLSFILLFRLMAHDVICLRNLAIQKFDAQFHSISRNFIEKCKIFCLCCYDEEFFENYTQQTKITDDDLYSKFTREGELNKRISKLAKSHNGKPIISFAQTLNADSLRSRIKHVCSPFVHTNNYRQIFSYALEGNKVNLSVLHSSNNNSVNTYKFMCEISILFYIELFWLTVGAIDQTVDTLHRQLIDIYGVYTKKYYS